MRFAPLKALLKWQVAFLLGLMAAKTRGQLQYEAAEDNPFYVDVDFRD